MVYNLSLTEPVGLFILGGVGYLSSVYKTRRWQKKREKILRRYDYLCQESKQYGLSKQAQTVHHIYPVDEYPELAYVDWNLLPITNQVHNTFHDRHTDQIIGRGLYWQQKRKREFDRWYQGHRGDLG